MVHKSNEKSVQSQMYAEFENLLGHYCSAGEYETIIDNAIKQIVCFSEFKEGGGVDVEIFYLFELRNFFKSISNLQKQA